MPDALDAVQQLRTDLAGIMVRFDQLAAQLGATASVAPDASSAPPRPSVTGRPFYGFTPKDGFHVLKDKWYQKSFIGVQSESLQEGLVDAIAATREAAPRRSLEQSFRLLSPSGRVAADQIRNKERKLEQRIYKQWKPCPEFRGCDAWHFIAAYQVPLFDASEKRGWGHIDLLGIDDQGLVVIELKDGSSKEPPTRPLMEAVSYAIALQKSWPSFLPELAALMDAHDVQLHDFDVQKIRLMILAPSDYWNRWRRAKRVTNESWDSYSRLVGGLRMHGFETRFAELSEDVSEVKLIGCPPDWEAL